MKEHTPLFLKFIHLVEKGFAALDDSSKAEVQEFVSSCQHAGGAFTDRAGKPDYYYSLFGTWLSVALGLEKLQENHKKFLLVTGGHFDNSIDELSSLLLKATLFHNEFKKPSLFLLLYRNLIKNSLANIFYRIFLLAFVIDSVYRIKMNSVFIRVPVKNLKPPADSPCSIHAAYAVVRNESGANVEQEVHMLNEFFEYGKGFKSFPEAGDADLLSTAVALYALNAVGADLRKITPDCLALIQHCYANGAFVAGNGDEERDLEYTFYGLLALGALIS